jgi:hypothetical protein
MFSGSISATFNNHFVLKSHHLLKDCPKSVVSAENVVVE